jgi:hypothetical protein
MVTGDEDEEEQLIGEYDGDCDAVVSLKLLTSWVKFIRDRNSSSSKEILCSDAIN